MRKSAVSPNDLIPFVKAWNSKRGDEIIYGEKEYFFNPAVPIRGMEPCILQRNGKEVQCVKIFYHNEKENVYITLVGTITEFIKTCQQASIATSLLFDLYAEGMTVKKFIEQTEGIQAH